MVSPEIEISIDKLQTRYIAALDNKLLTAWYDTFSNRPDSSYVCTSAENVSAGLPVAQMLDDNRARIADRVTFITKVWNGTFQDYQTRHFVQRLSCQASGKNSYRVITNFSVVFTPEGSGDSRFLACGIYEDEIIEEANALHFLRKRAITDTCVLPHYLVYPI